MDAVKTGIFIREQRKKMGLSQQQLAGLLHVEPQTVSKWERGLGMPDYDNLDRLKQIFQCSLTDILEPPDVYASAEEEAENGGAEVFSGLPVLWTGEETNSDNRTKKGFSLQNILKLLNRQRMKEMVGRAFGCEYEHVYTERFLFKGLLNKRTAKERDTAITQGMFRDSDTHTVLGIEAPWLWFRVLIMMLFCTFVGMVCSILTQNPIYGVIFCGSLVAIPLLVFIFESNFARNISILDVIKYFLLGGMISIILTILFVPMSESDALATIGYAPVFEEVAKAVVAAFFISKLKTKSVISGLLIGFSVGAGFTVFENLQYGINFFTIEFLSELVLGNDAVVSLENANATAMATALIRSLSDVFAGHHYWTGIFGACFVLLGKQEKPSLKGLFHWRVLLTLVVCIFLHSFFNFGAMLGGVAETVIQLIFVEIPSVVATIVLINIGIAQFKLNAIYEASKDKENADEAEENPSEGEQADGATFCASTEQHTDVSGEELSDKAKNEEINA
jgi:RsiW-degrading membrane proteinase PrsW (M82 family)/transcriptional regulator with XRE-family HTH domain